MEDLATLLSKKEDLHPDLLPYTREVPHLGMCIRHPLVYSIMHNDEQNALVNAQYKHKLEALEKAKESKSWLFYIFLYERPYRAEPLLKLANSPHLITDEEYWPLAASVLIDTENFREWRSSLQAILSPLRRDISKRHLMMSSDEQELLSSFPEEVTIYRGCIIGNKKGWSWTLSKEKATWFANRFKSRVPVVISASCEKKHVVAYFNRRGEDEIFINPIYVKGKQEE